MSAHPRPRVVISRCIDFDSCRYDGQVIRASLREELEPHVDFVPICPELEIGLGVPRDPVRLVLRSGAAHMVQPATGRDVTAQMESFSRDFLSGPGTADAFILKARSPSCGVRSAKVFHTDDDGAAFDSGPGLFAARVLERFPHAAVEDEARMNDLGLRHHFLTKAFALAGVRAAAAAGLPALIDFHARSKLLLMAHSEALMRRLGRLLGGSVGGTDGDVAREYAAQFAAALARPSRLSAPQAVLASWAARFDVPYLARQTFLEPYPPQLARFERVTKRQRRSLREVPGAAP